MFYSHFGLSVKTERVDISTHAFEKKNQSYFDDKDEKHGNLSEGKSSFQSLQYFDFITNKNTSLCNEVNLSIA